MKKFNIVMIVICVLLFAVCIFQQLELWAIADEINNINEFIENQLELNMTLLDIMEMLVK